MKNRAEKLIEEHLNCVHWVIHHFIHVDPGVCGLEYDDLYQEGCIALWRAAGFPAPPPILSFHPLPARAIIKRGKGVSLWIPCQRLTL